MITSFSDALAFYFGSMATSEALHSFCLFCCSTVIMLYLIVITVFLSALIWDTRRVSRKCGDCFCLCLCSESTLICLRGRFLSVKQRAYSGLPPRKASAPDAGAGSEEASATEKCLSTCLAPCLLSWFGNIIILLIYAALILGAIYGCTLVTLDFKTEYMIGVESDVYSYF